jgi:hypothetical protein
MEQEKYSFDDIKAMFDNFNYYSYNQLSYVYNKVNGNQEMAQFFLDLCLEDNKKIEKEVEKMVTEEDLQKINENENENEIILQ